MSGSSHFERCEQNVRNYAYGLSIRVKAKKLNASAFEGLVESFINQSNAIDTTWKAKMLEAAMEYAP